MSDTEIAGLVPVRHAPGEGTMTRLNLEQLRTFSVVLRTGGIVKAAHVLGLTQPAVTARIKSLEALIGGPLLERSPSGMRATRRGNLLQRHLDRLDLLAGQIERDLCDPHYAEGVLRIGACEIIGLTWMPQWLQRIKTAFAKVEVCIRIDEPDRLKEAFVAREIDVVILPEATGDANAVCLDLPQMQMAWFGAAELVARADPGRLLGCPVIAHWPTSRAFRVLTERVADHVGVDVPIFASCSYATSLRLVADGTMVTALPRLVGQAAAPDGVVEFDAGLPLPDVTGVVCYVHERQNLIAEQAAHIACEVAVDMANASLRID